LCRAYASVVYGKAWRAGSSEEFNAQSPATEQLITTVLVHIHPFSYVKSLIIYFASPLPSRRSCDYHDLCKDHRSNGQNRQRGWSRDDSDTRDMAKALQRLLLQMRNKDDKFRILLSRHRCTTRLGEKTSSASKRREQPALWLLCYTIQSPLLSKYSRQPRPNSFRCGDRYRRSR
jgi:hypothetical protein